MTINLPNRQRLLLILAGGGVLLLILDRIVFTPLTTMWTTHSAEIVKLQKSVTDGRATISRANRIQGVWADMQRTALPKEPGEAEQQVITEVDRWGRTNGIELGSIRPQWKRGATDRYSLLECRVDATGTLATLTRFLYELENSRLALRVDSVEMTSRDDAGSKISLGIVVTGLRLAPLERKQ